jgi:monothiol glutaredoxin
VWTTDDVRNKVEQAKVVVFLKGTADQPRCGFSERVVSAMEKCGRPFEVINVYEDRSIIPALTAYAGRQCLPLVYINGKLESSSETQERQLDSGELSAKVEAAFKQ